MATRMKHAEHGFHIAYTPEEIEVLKKSGWELDPTWDDGKTIQPEPEKKKPGRPKKAN